MCSRPDESSSTGRPGEPITCCRCVQLHWPSFRCACLGQIRGDEHFVSQSSCRTDSRPAFPGGRSLADFGPYLADFGPNLVDAGPHFPAKLAEIGWSLTDTGPNSVDSGPCLVDFGPMSADVGPNLVNFGPMLLDSGSISAGCRFRAKFGRLRANFGRIRTRFGRPQTDFYRHWPSCPNMGRIQPGLGQFRAKLVDLGWRCARF